LRRCYIPTATIVETIVVSIPYGNATSRRNVSRSLQPKVD